MRNRRALGRPSGAVGSRRRRGIRAAGVITGLLLAVAMQVPGIVFAAAGRAEAGATSPAPSTGAPSSTSPPSPTPPPEASETPGPEASVSASVAPTSVPSGTPQGTGSAPPATRTPQSTRPALPPHEPARETSSIPAASIVVASIALAACALALWVAVRRNRAAGEVGIAELPGTAGGSGDDTVSAEPLDADPTLRFLVALGEAMIDSSAPVTQVTHSLRDVARVNGRPDAELIVLSTALMVSSSEGSKVQTVAASAGRRSLRLEQIDAVFDIVDEAEHAALTPRRGLERLDEVRRMPATFSTPQRIAGYVGMALGLALVLKAGWVDLAVAGLLGVCVGTVLLTTSNVATAYRPFIPVGCAFGVSLVVFLLSNASADIGVFAPIVAPLVTLLPGALLTTSLIELATGDMISGAGRLAAGAMQLVLLALGIVSAAQLVGVGTSTVTDVTSAPLGVAAPWVGVAVFGLGAGVHLCARRSAIPWILLVLYVAYAGQVLGGVLLGPVLSGFVGALLLTPVAMLVSTRPTGPYTFVSFLPAFWLLVPGALGLAGVTQFLGDNRLDGAASLVTTGLAMLGIALGALLGLGAGSALAVGVRSRRGA